MHHIDSTVSALLLNKLFIAETEHELAGPLGPGTPGRHPTLTRGPGIGVPSNGALTLFVTFRFSFLRWFKIRCAEVMMKKIPAIF